MGVAMSTTSAGVRRIVSCQVADLLVAVAHRRQDRASLWVFGEGFGNRARGVGFGVDDFSHAKAPCRHPAGAVLHLTVGQRRAILDRG